MPAKANAAVNCHSRMELRPPTARKSHRNFFAHCKRSTKMKKYKKKLSSQMRKSPWERKSPQWFQTIEN